MNMSVLYQMWQIDLKNIKDKNLVFPNILSTNTGG